MSSTIVALQLNLLGLGAVAGVHQLCRKTRIPPPPLKLAVLAVALMPWLTLITAADEPFISGGAMPYLNLANLMIGSFTAIGLAAWLTLDLPPRMGWWKPLPRILVDLIRIGAGVLIALALIHVQLKINLIGIATTSAILTAIVAFAAQSTLKDIFAGIALQLDAPFKEGDWIDLGFARGIVLSLRLMSTRLRTIDSAEVIVPNSRIASEGLRRFQAEEPVGHSFDIALEATMPARQAIRLIEHAIKHHPQVLSQPKPRIWVSCYSEMGVVYQAQYWQEGLGDLAERQVRSEILEQIWYALRRVGGTLPYPGRVIRDDRKGRRESEASYTTEEGVDALERTGLFAGLNKNDKAEFASKGRYLIYGPGEAVFHQDEEGDAFYILMKGDASVSRQENGYENTNFRTLKPGDIFGEIAVFTGEKRSASIICREETHVLAFDREDLLLLIQKAPETLTRLSELVARRQQELSEYGEWSHSDEDVRHLSSKIRHFLDYLLRKRG
jgi:small-conductance mechanosensitive channel/CRP-like cAMP-binding protein